MYIYIFIFVYIFLAIIFYQPKAITSQYGNELGRLDQMGCWVLTVCISASGQRNLGGRGQCLVASL